MEAENRKVNPADKRNDISKAAANGSFALSDDLDYPHVVVALVNSLINIIWQKKDIAVEYIFSHALNTFVLMVMLALHAQSQTSCATGQRCHVRMNGSLGHILLAQKLKLYVLNQNKRA